MSIMSIIQDAVEGEGQAAAGGGQLEGFDPHWNELVPSQPVLKSLHVLYLVMGTFISLFGLTSLIIKNKLYMTEAMVAVIIGIIMGPLGAKLIVPTIWFPNRLPTLTLEFTRIVLAIQCMACGVDLPGNYLWKEKISIAMLLGPVMVVMWLVSAVGIYLILSLPFLDALIISACMTPTDPVLANSIVKGVFAEKHIPLNVRLILSAESGANDGLGSPFLLLALYIQRYSNTGLAIWDFFYRVILYQIVLAIVIAIVFATLARIGLRYAEEKEWIDKESILSFTIALTLTLMGLVSLIGADDILAVFIAGNVLTWDKWFNECVSATHFQEVIDALLNLTYFVFIGSIIPWSSYNSIPSLEVWKLVVLALWVMCLRRPPIVLALQKWIPALKTKKEAFFAGWFGPIGAGAIFYALASIVVFDYPPTPLLEITLFIVLSSVVVHGISVPFFDMSLSMSRVSTWTPWATRRTTTRRFTTPRPPPPSRMASAVNQPFGDFVVQVLGLGGGGDDGEESSRCGDGVGEGECEREGDGHDGEVERDKTLADLGVSSGETGRDDVNLCVCGGKPPCRCLCASGGEENSDTNASMNQRARRKADLSLPGHDDTVCEKSVDHGMQE